MKEAAEDSGVPLLLVLAVAVQAALPALVQVRGDVIAGAILHKRLPTLLQLLHFCSVRQNGLANNYCGEEQPGLEKPQFFPWKCQQMYFSERYTSTLPLSFTLH